MRQWSQDRDVKVPCRLGQSKEKARVDTAWAAFGKNGVQSRASGQMACAENMAEQGRSWGLTNTGSHPFPVSVVRKQSSPRPRKTRVRFKQRGGMDNRPLCPTSANPISPSTVPKGQISPNFVILSSHKS